MADDMARARGFELRRTLTGFKFVGEQIGLLESQDRENDFLMGFEESYGYLAGTSVRDKDAVVATMLVCELASYWKARNKGLHEVMEALYERYGYWRSAQLSQIYEGPKGDADMAAIMAGLRADTPAEVAGIDISQVIDYAGGAVMPAVNPSDSQTLPTANVVELRLSDGSRLLFRPSGTESKAKAYVFAKGEDCAEAEEKLAALNDFAKRILEGENR